MFDDPLTLNDDQLEQLAGLIATKLAAARSVKPPMLTVEDVSNRFGVSRAWVYENARRLGGVRLGPGERAPIRFDPDTVAAALCPIGQPEQKRNELAAKPGSRRRRATRLHPVHDV
jgi:hypothetical protein